MSRSSADGTSGSVTRLVALESALRADLPALALGGVGGFLWDVTAELIHLDEEGRGLFGLESDEYDGSIEMFQSHVVPEDLPALRATVRDALAHHDGYRVFLRIRRTGSDTRWVHVQGHIQRDAAGVARRVVGVARDATTELTRLTDDRERYADSVHAITSALSRSVTVEDVRSALTTGAVLRPLGAKDTSIVLLGQNRLRRLPTASLPAALVGDQQHLGLDEAVPVSEAVRTQTPLFLSRYDISVDYPKMWAYVSESPISAGAVLPLVAQGRPIGALMILYDGKDTFAPEERNLLLALAAAVGQSLQRAVAYDEEHAIAVGLQQSMLPARIPDVPGLRIAARYRPAESRHQIGGDWYDVVPLPDGRVGLVVGDVEGHDIHASAVMGQLRTALRAYAAEGHPPAALMARASVFLHDLDTGRFATCCYADLDPVTGRVAVVRAGHHDPLVGHADGTTDRPRLAGGLPLGLTQFGSTSYPVTHFRLAPGDTLLICTDGLIEHEGKDIDEGIDEIAALFPDGPHDTDLLAEHIVTTIASRHRQEDDIALLLTSLTGGS